MTDAHERTYVDGPLPEVQEVDGQPIISLSRDDVIGYSAAMFVNGEGWSPLGVVADYYDLLAALDEEFPPGSERRNKIVITEISVFDLLSNTDLPLTGFLDDDDDEGDEDY